MIKIIIYLFITFLLNSQDIKIYQFDSTADYWQAYYENQKKQIEEMTIKNFENHKKIQIYYKGDWRKRVCYSCKYPYRYIELKKFILYSCYEINNYSFSYGKFRGIFRFGNWYFFKLLDWYEIRYEDFIKEYQVYIYSMNDTGEIAYSGAGEIIAKIRYIEFQDEQMKAIDFYYIYNSYMERYSFTIIFQKECL